MMKREHDIDAVIPERTLLDGGMGTALLARGIDLDEHPPELWNAIYPERVREVHEEFVAAGADAIQTNSFGASRLRLKARGLADRARELNIAAAALARQARPAGSVIGSIGPTGYLPPPEGSADLCELEATFGEQAAALAEGGVDLLHVETMAHAKEMRAAIRGARDGAPNLPLAVSMSCKRCGESYATSLGYAAETLIEVMLEEEVEFAGVNCALGPGDLLDLASRLVETGLPVIAQPTLTPDGAAALHRSEFATGAQALFALGVRAVGGCCGTEPADIAAARAVLIEQG